MRVRQGSSRPFRSYQESNDFRSFSRVAAELSTALALNVENPRTTRVYPLFMKFRFASRPMSLRDRFRPQSGPAPADPDREAKAASALAGKRGRASFAPPPNAGKAAAALMRPLLPMGGVGFSELKRRWAEIAGPAFSKTAPEKLAGGVLTVRAPGALAPFLQQQIPLLVERLRVAGAKISQVRIEQRSAAPKNANLRAIKAPLSSAEETALAHGLDRIGDPGLRSALMRLARAVKQG